MGSDPANTSKTGTCTFAFNATDRPADSGVAPYRCGCGASYPQAGHEGPISAPRNALTWSFSGADDGIRTRDPHLGKVMLYH